MCLDENVLADLLAGRLSTETNQRVHAHLDACSACRELVGLLAGTGDAREGPSSVENVAPGVIVGGRYRIDRRLGAGATGIVHAATDVRSGERVALKVLRERDEHAARRFSREVRITQALSHPNLVTVKDVFLLDDGTNVLAMELLDGRAFSAHLALGPLPLGEVAAVLCRVCRGVASAHARGVIHRDLKPENVFLTAAPQPEVKVLDFGLAKPTATDGLAAKTATLTVTGARVGTPRYMAPEQLFGEANVDARADVWAIGVMLYVATTGRPPFTGASFGELLRNVATESIVPLEARLAGVPADVADLAGRMLTKDALRRSVPVGEIHDVLARHARW